MLVSVVIPTHNRPERLAVALRSVEAQGLGDSLEVIVVNDHGLPVAEVIEAQARTMRVRLIEQRVSGGPAAARNAALAAAEGTFVAFLDDDDVWAPHHLATVLPVLRAGADFVYVDTPIARTRVTGETIAEAEVFVRLDFPFDRGLLEVTNHIPPTAVVCRSPRAVDAWFDPDIPVEEDWDMWLQLVHRCRYRVVHQPGTTIALHRVPGVTSLTTPTSDDVKALRGFEDNWHRICERWPSTTARVDRVRRFMPRMYRLAYDMMDGGEPLDHHYYERTLRVLYHALGDPAPSTEQVEAGLVAALHGRSPGTGDEASV